MQRTIIIKAALAAITLLVACGCNKGFNKGAGDTVIVIKQTKGQPIAEVGKSVLTVEAMKEDFLARQGQFRGAPNLNTEKARNDYMENQVMQEAMFLDAIEQNYFEKPEILRDVKKIVVQKLMRDKLEKAQGEFVPTEAQILEHYNTHKNLYNRDEAVKVAYISVPFGKDKNKAKEVAATIYKDALETVKNANTKMFSRLAIKHAQEVMTLGTTTVETNETDYLDKPTFEAKFGPNSFDPVKSIEPMGQISPVVMSGTAFVVMMKSGYRKAIAETLEDAKPKIIKRLAYESRGEIYKKYTEDLRKKYSVKVYQERLAELSKGAAPANMADLANKGGALPGASNPQGAHPSAIPGKPAAIPQANQAPDQKVGGATPGAPTENH